MIVLVLLAALLDHNIKKKGNLWVIMSALNAVITIALYKYDITNFNSVVGEQLPIYFLLLIYFSFFARVVSKQNPFVLLRRPVFAVQSFSQGLASIVDSFAFGFAPASVILSAKRSSAVFWTIFAGNWFFKETHIAFKIALFAALLLGIALLAL